MSYRFGPSSVRSVAHVGRLGDREDMLRLASPDRVRLAGRLEPLGRELADRLEHPEALVRPPHEALLDERLEHVEVGVADRLGRLERAAAGKTASRAKSCCSSASSRS